MKKVSLLVLICMIAVLVLATMTSCSHTHTYGEEWVFDHENHYHVCTECDAKDASTVAAHADSDNDGDCDVCGIILDNAHVYSPNWSADATHHWHAPLCGHSVEVADKAEHTENELGVCSVCYNVNDPDVSTIEKALAIAALTQNKVMAGTVNMEQGGAPMLVTFQYGNEYLHIIYTNEDGMKNVYVTANGDGTYLYVENDQTDSYSPVEIDKAASSDKYAGPVIPMSAIGGTDVYGAVNLVNYLYTGLSAASFEGYDNQFAESVADGVYSFSYKYKEADYAYYTEYSISVSFTLDATGKFINKLSGEITDDYGTVCSVEFEQGALANSNNTLEDITPTDFTLKDQYEMPIEFGENLTSAAFDIYVSEYAISVSAEAPFGALIEALDSVAVVIKDANGDEVSAASAYGYYSASSKKVELTFKTAGTYNVNITLGEKTYVVPFNVTWQTPEVDDFVPSVLGYNMFGEPEFMAADATYSIYNGQVLKFKVVLPSTCNPTLYTIAIKEDTTGATITANESEDLNFDGNNDLVYDFVATEAGTYTVVFTSTADGVEISKEISITTIATPAAADLAKGVWTASEMGVMGSTTTTVTFYPTNDTKGIVTVSVDTMSRMGSSSATGVFTYYIKGEQITAAFVSGTYATDGGEPEADEGFADAVVSITSSYVISFTADAYSNTTILEQTATDAGELPAEFAEIEVPDAPQGEVIPELPQGMQLIRVDGNCTLKYQVTIAAGETVTFTFDNWTTGDFNITVTEGATVVHQTIGGDTCALDDNPADNIVNIVGCEDYTPAFIITNTGAEEAVVIVDIVVSNA